MTGNNATAISKVSESRLQATCFKWAYNTYPQIRGLFFSIPNGGTRNIREAATLKATGLTPGIPDMILLYQGKYGFEFKSSIGKVSSAQQKIHDIWRNEGIKVFIIQDEDLFKIIMDEIVRIF